MFCNSNVFSVFRKSTPEIYSEYTVLNTNFGIDFGMGGCTIAHCFNRMKQCADDFIEEFRPGISKSGVALDNGAIAYNELVDSKKV